MNIKFHFREPTNVIRRKPYRGVTLEDAHREIYELRMWIEALTEQLECTIGKDVKNNGEKTV